MADPETTDRTAPNGIDETLLARMTGKAGDPATIRQKASDLAAALCGPLEASMAETAGLSATVVPGDVDLARRSALEATIGESDVRCPASIRPWCRDVSMSTGAAMAIAFAGSLLGGSEAETADRPLSPVELDISIMLFEQLLDALKRVLGLGEAVAAAGAPVAAPPAEDDERPDAHAVMITLQVTFGGLSAPLRILLPQEAVLKATIVLPKPEGAAASDPPEWAESLTRQVRRSNVTLRARISLAQMTLGDIVRMKPGDVLPFADGRDVDVRLDANGRDLARCELGRSGSRYMLRLRPAASLGAELMRDMP